MLGLLLSENIRVWATQFQEDIQPFVLPFLIVLAAIGAVYVIVLGVKLGTAASADEFKKAKENFVRIIISYLVIVILCALFLFLVNQFANGLEFKMWWS